MEPIQELKNAVRKFREVDDELRVINKTVYQKREERKILELEISDILKDPQFQAINKLKIDEDGSTISIKRPETWSKPWSLSQKELLEYLKKYMIHRLHLSEDDAESTYRWIIEEKKKTLLASEYSFTRKVSEEDE